MAEKQIIYTGGFRFPEGDAGAARVLGVGMALREIGYSVLYAGAEAAGRPEDLAGDGGYYFKGFRYFSQNENRTTKLNPAMRLLRYFQVARNTVRWLETLDASQIHAVILYNGYSSHHWRLKRYCARHRLPLISDVTEWYDPGQCVGGRYGIVRWDVEMTLRHWAPSVDGVIAITRFLETHLSRPGHQMLRLPPLIDIRDAKWCCQEPRPGGGLRLGFAGHAGNKDYLRNAIRALGMLGEKGKDIQIVIVGPPREELARDLGEDAGLLDKLAKQLEFTGRLPHPQALRRVGECDFSLMLRPDKTYANAGFPTKMVESFACGVPLLGNVTGDIGLYARDGQEAVLVRDFSPEACLAGLERALQTSPEQRAQMKRMARAVAEQHFDYRAHLDGIREFIQAVARKNN